MTLICRADCERPSGSPACPCGAALAARCRRPRRGASSRSRGFSFTEILFAVIVLGIGFIMIAAIFPVAIQQGKLTSEEGTATGVAREALNYLGQVGANSDSIANSSGGPLFPATGLSTTYTAPYTGIVYSFIDPQPNEPVNSQPNSATSQPSNYPLNTPQQPIDNTLLSAVATSTQSLWYRLNLSLIVPSDQRYAFVGLYKRDGNPWDRRTWSPYAQVWFIPVTARSRSIYAAGTVNAPGLDISGTPAGPGNLQARLVRVQITDPTGTFSTSKPGGYVLYNYTSGSTSYTGSTYLPNALAENGYVIIADDQSTGRMNGHSYHLGLRRPDLDGSDVNGNYMAYDLAPNGDFAPDPGADGYFGSADDIVAIGNTAQAGTTSTIVASHPADAYVVGLDDSTGAEPGTSQDISAFTTFIKVN